MIFHNGSITYKELGQLISKMSETQQEKDVEIYLFSSEEFLPVYQVTTIKQAFLNMDVGHPYIVVDN